MPLVDLVTAKRELRVLHDAEDEDIARKLAAAEEQVEQFLGRAVYADQAALDAALDAAPAALTAASEVYETALAALSDVENAIEYALHHRRARDAYREAQDVWERTVRAMVVNETIRTAILLIAASLWEHRGDEDGVLGIPTAARTLLWPFRTGLGA